MGEGQGLSGSLRRHLVGEKHASRTALSHNAPEPSQSVQRAVDPTPSPVQNVGVDHGGLEARMAQELLDGPDVVAAHQQMGREGVPQGVHGRRFGQACLQDGCPKGPLDLALAQMIAPDPAALGIYGSFRRREDVLPSPFALRSRIFGRERIGQMDPPVALFEVLPMKLAHPSEVVPQGRRKGGRQHGGPVFSSFPIAHGDLVLAEVDVFDAQA